MMKIEPETECKTIEDVFAFNDRLHFETIPKSAHDMARAGEQQVRVGPYLLNPKQTATLAKYKWIDDLQANPRTAFMAAKWKAPRVLLLDEKVVDVVSGQYAIFENLSDVKDVITELGLTITGQRCVAGGVIHVDFKADFLAYEYQTVADQPRSTWKVGDTVRIRPEMIVPTKITQSSYALRAHIVMDILRCTNGMVCPRPLGRPLALFHKEDERTENGQPDIKSFVKAMFDSARNAQKDIDFAHDLRLTRSQELTAYGTALPYSRLKVVRKMPETKSLWDVQMNVTSDANQYRAESTKYEVQLKAGAIITRFREITNKAPYRQWEALRAASNFAKLRMKKECDEILRDLPALVEGEEEEPEVQDGSIIPV